MKGLESRESGYVPTILELDEIRTINGFAQDNIDAEAFCHWLLQHPTRYRIAMTCRLIAYGCEYAHGPLIDASLQHPGLVITDAVSEIVGQLRSSERGRGFLTFFDEPRVFEQLEQQTDEEILRTARWAFVFYAMNDNWQKFQECRP